MHIASPTLACNIRFDNLAAMLIVECRRDNFQFASAGLRTKPVKFTNWCVHDRVQRFGRCHYATSEVGIRFTEASHLCKVNLNFLRVVAPHIAQRARVELHCLQAFDIAIPYRPEDLVRVEDAASHDFAVSAQGGGTEINNPGIGKARLQRFPTLGDAVMAFIEQDQVEIVFWKSLQPTFGIALQLLNVRDDNMRFVQVCTVRRRAANLYRFGIRRTSKYLALLIKHCRIAWIEVGGQLLSDTNAGCNNKSAG